jgi:hypothetical protein
MYPKANKDHRCCECSGEIKRGEKYQKVKGCWDGKWHTFKTCEDCADLRHELTHPIDGPPAFGYLEEVAQDYDVPMPQARR